MYKIGNGIDIHKLVKNKPLIIGGVNIPSKRGAVSFSDGDALIHSLVDALLGALNKGDIGTLFPDTNNQYKNKESTYFLKEVKRMIDKENYKISNIDMFIVLEEPKLSSYKNKVIKNLANILSIDPKLISLKAGTNEKIGKIGHKKALLCWSSVLIEKN